MTEIKITIKETNEDCEKCRLFSNTKFFKNLVERHPLCKDEIALLNGSILRLQRSDNVELERLGYRLQSIMNDYRD